MMEGENEMLASMLSDMALRFKKKKQIDKTRLEEKSLQVLMKNLPKYDDPELFAFVPVGYLEYLWKRATDFETLNTDTAPLFYNRSCMESLEMDSTYNVSSITLKDRLTRRVKEIKVSNNNSLEQIYVEGASSLRTLIATNCSSLAVLFIVAPNLQTINLEMSAINSLLLDVPLLGGTLDLSGLIFLRDVTLKAPLLRDIKFANENRNLNSLTLDCKTMKHLKIPLICWFTLTFLDLTFDGMDELDFKVSQGTSMRTYPLSQVRIESKQMTKFSIFNCSSWPVFEFECPNLKTFFAGNCFKSIREPNAPQTNVSSWNVPSLIEVQFENCSTADWTRDLQALGNLHKQRQQKQEIDEKKEAHEQEEDNKQKENNPAENKQEENKQEKAENVIPRQKDTAASLFD